MAKGSYGPWTSVDLDAEGRQAGFIYAPFTETRSAYRAIPIPIVVLRGGPGPTLLLTGGVHGDEYEGQVALCRLVQELQPRDLAGGAIILPATNLPAATAATRLSPIDGGNLNAAFPGDPDGGPTLQIASFIERELLPRAVAWVDLHSGGSSLEYLPLAAIHHADDPSLQNRGLSALKAFGAPCSMVFRYQHERAASSAAQRHDRVYVYGEFGGGGGLNAAGLEVAYRGLLRTLAHFGAIPDLDRFDLAPAEPTEVLETVTGDSYRETRRNFAFAERAGVFEPRCRLGETVTEGQLLGYIHAPEYPQDPPREVEVPMSGTLIARRHPARVAPGDCLAQIAVALRDHPPGPMPGAEP